jgi:hypothetical protein
MDTLPHEQNRLSAAIWACLRKSRMSFTKHRAVNQPLTKGADL